MKITNILATTIMALLLATSASAGVFDIEVLNAGDGFWHNETGTSYDYFNSTSNAISAHYSYYGTSDTLSYNIGYTQFALENAPDISDIVSVSLYGYFNSSYLTAPTPTAGNVYHVANASTATGNASQRLNGAELVTPVDGDMGIGWTSVDVTSFLLNDLTNDYSWAAFSFLPNTSGNYYDRNAGFNIASAESGNAAFLRFETSDTSNTNAVPEPATMVLFTTGLIGFAVKRRKA